MSVIIPRPSQSDRLPIKLAYRGKLDMMLSESSGSAARLAADMVSRVVSEQIGCSTDVVPLRAGQSGDVYCLCGPYENQSLEILRSAGIEVNADGVLAALDGLSDVRRKQAFVAASVPGDSGKSLILAAETDTGLRNALITLSDRLYLDADGSLVADPFDGVHAPAFDARHIKTDAMNCGPLRCSLEYWDPTTKSGIDEFARWLASFRITDYDFLAFVRGWGTSYSSERFTDLVDPQHPNPKYEFYPQLIDRLHDWGIKVWASDVFIASGYTMEMGTNSAMLSPCVDASRLEPYKAGKGAFWEILGDPNAIACLSHPSASGYYAALVDDLIKHYPSIDGLDFHIGHTFTEKICRCPECRNLAGNREAVYRCFAKAYETAVANNSEIRVKAAVKMFGDATRKIVERCEEFPNLEFFCWLRWAGNLSIEGTDAPVTVGHEDGGGGLEMTSHDPGKTLADVRKYFRDYEPWIRTYIWAARQAKFPSISWEPALHRELEQQYFIYSQLTWEPDLTWEELARRFVIRSQRKMDARLCEAYRLALEANAGISSWGLADYEAGVAQRVIQNPDLVYRPAVMERIAALGDLIRSMGIRDPLCQTLPVEYDLKWAIAGAWRRLATGEALGTWH